MKVQGSNNNVILRPTLLATSLSLLFLASPPRGEATTLEEMETAGQIQWLLALDGCSVGPVDGLLSAVRGTSKTERCLSDRELSIAMRPRRLLNEVNSKIRLNRGHDLPLAEMQKALQGIDSRSGARDLRPSLFDRTQAARMSLLQLAFSDAFPYLLLGITSSDKDISDWAEMQLKKDAANHDLPEALWQIVLEQGEVSSGIARFFGMLDGRERPKHTLLLIDFYLADRDRGAPAAVNSAGMLADLMRTLWKPVLKKADHGADDLVVMTRTVFDAYASDRGDRPVSTLGESEVARILDRFGDDIIRPLAVVYAEAEEDGSSDRVALIEQYLRELNQPMVVLKQTALAMNSNNEASLGRLVASISSVYQAN